VGEVASTRAGGSGSGSGGGGFFSGINEIVFGKRELEIPEEVATDRANYVADVKDVLTGKEGMLPGHTYQEDLKHRFKELMRKNPQYRELTGPELLEVLVKTHPDENPFRGDRYDRLQMRIQEQVKEVQIEKVTRKHEASAFAARTGAAPMLPPRAASAQLRTSSRDAAPSVPATGMAGVQGRNRAQTLAGSTDAAGENTRQRSIKFADDAVDEATLSRGRASLSRSYSEGDLDEADDGVGDLPASATPQQQPGFLTRVFSSQSREDYEAPKKTPPPLPKR